MTLAYARVSDSKFGGYDSEKFLNKMIWTCNKIKYRPMTGDPYHMWACMEQIYKSKLYTNTTIL